MLEGLMDGWWSPQGLPFTNVGFGPAGDADGGEFAMDGRPAGDISLTQVRRGTHMYICFFITLIEILYTLGVLQLGCW